MLCCGHRPKRLFLPDPVLPPSVSPWVFPPVLSAAGYGIGRYLGKQRYRTLTDADFAIEVERFTKHETEIDRADRKSCDREHAIDRERAERPKKGIRTIGRQVCGPLAQESLRRCRLDANTDVDNP